MEPGEVGVASSSGYTSDDEASMDAMSLPGAASALLNSKMAKHGAFPPQHAVCKGAAHSAAVEPVCQVGGVQGLMRCWVQTLRIGFACCCLLWLIVALLSGLLLCCCAFL